MDLSAPPENSELIKLGHLPMDTFLIVGVGASAGGLNAFRRLLEHLPAEPGMSFVLVPHLSPSHESQMSSILQRSTKMPIREVKVGLVVVEPNHVYIISPNTMLVLAKGKLHATRPRPAGPYYKCIDDFLVSLAEEARERAIGIVLSGALSDGAIGIKAVKSGGGITFAQDESAEFPAMPQAAIATGSVDFVLPPEAIAQQLVRIGQHA